MSLRACAVLCAAVIMSTPGATDDGAAAGGGLLEGLPLPDGMPADILTDPALIRQANRALKRAREQSPEVDALLRAGPDLDLHLKGRQERSPEMEALLKAGPGLPPDGPHQAEGGGAAGADGQLSEQETRNQALRQDIDRAWKDVYDKVMREDFPYDMGLPGADDPRMQGPNSKRGDQQPLEKQHEKDDEYEQQMGVQQQEESREDEDEDKYAYEYADYEYRSRPGHPGGTQRHARQRAAAPDRWGAELDVAGPNPNHPGHPSMLYRQNCAHTGDCSLPYHLRRPVPVPPDAPPGHLRPLGDETFRPTWDGQVDEMEGVPPVDRFWREYHAKRPFVARGFGTAHPAFRAWADDDEMERRFGTHKVKLERKNEDRLTDYCGSHDQQGKPVHCGPEVRPHIEAYCSLSTFLRGWRKDGWDRYAITQLPEPMAADVLVMPSLMCGARDPDDTWQPGWMTQLYEANLWLSHNYGQQFSSSVLHYDMNHQLMCVYSGEKEWIFFEPGQVDKIPMWKGALDPHFKDADNSDDSPLDGERVDLLRYPRFAQARWTNTTLKAGDCLYIPAFHLHYVRSYGRNVAATYMYQIEVEHNRNCDDSPAAPLSLSKFDILWSFPGKEGEPEHDLVKMGMQNWKEAAKWLLEQPRAKNGDVSRRIFKVAIERIASEATNKREEVDALVEQALTDFDDVAVETYVKLLEPAVAAKTPLQDIRDLAQRYGTLPADLFYGHDRFQALFRRLSIYPSARMMHMRQQVGSEHEIYSLMNGGAGVPGRMGTRKHTHEEL